jgi:hypothetical protein
MDIVIIPVIVIGIILGILELIFVHQDEAGMGWLSHGLHALPVMFIFIFISMNVNFVLHLINPSLNTNLWLTIGIRVLIGIIAAVKIKAAAAVAGRVGESWAHVLIIATLVIVAPFIWEMFLCSIPFIKGLPLNGCPAVK